VASAEPVTKWVGYRNDRSFKMSKFIHSTIKVPLNHEWKRLCIDRPARKA